MEHLNITYSFKDISEMSKMRFKKVIKSCCDTANFKNLIDKKQSLSKGKELSYKKLEVQSYLKSGYGLTS